jgi:hypothetical protein
MSVHSFLTKVKAKLAGAITEAMGSAAPHILGVGMSGGFDGVAAVAGEMGKKTKMLRKGVNEVLASVKESNVRSSKMRSLKDVLVEKIASARQPKPAMNKLACAVGDNDIAFFSKLAEVTPIEKRAAGYLNEALESAIPALQAAGIGILGANLASGIYDKASEYYKKEQAYNGMFTDFPELNEVPREQVDKYWGLLSDYAPKLTINSLVAGQFVKNMLDFGVKGVDHNVAGQLIKMESDARGAGGWSDFSKMMGGIGSESFKSGLGAMGDQGQGPRNGFGGQAGPQMPPQI